MVEHTTDSAVIDPNQSPTRKDIEELEDWLKTLPQVELKTQNDFVSGLYARTIFIPRGTTLVGAVHSSENFLFIREGSITIWTDGHEHHFKAGDLVLSKAGVKRVGLAHSDVVLTTVHPNPENITDEVKIWDTYTDSNIPLLNQDQEPSEVQS
jgi:quercetin dioxygenase-like cupin family protein